MEVVQQNTVDIKNTPTTAVALPSEGAANITAAVPDNGTEKEVSSTTDLASSEQQYNKIDEPLTKSTFRRDVFTKMRSDKTALKNQFYRIPYFVDYDKAAELLFKTTEFQNAKNIKINFDPPQKPIIIESLKANKNVFLSANRNSSALLEKIDNSSLNKEDIDEQNVTDIFKSKEKKSEILPEDKVVLDMFVIGSNAVSPNGHRIGNGNGFVDLEFGTLVSIGAITDKTIIVTTIHDDQLIEGIPATIFEKFDFPVDLIVTPTTVVRAPKRLERPSGIYWDLLTSRRVDVLPSLTLLKEKDEKDGKTIILKELDSAENERKAYPVKRFARFANNRNKLHQKVVGNKKNRISSTTQKGDLNEQGDVTHKLKEPNTESPNKKSLRLKMWKQFRENNLAELTIFNRIPIFSEHNKATDLLIATDEFKNAENIQTYYDRVLHDLKIHGLKAKKNVYLPSARFSEGILFKLNFPEEGQEITKEYLDSIKTKKNALKAEDQIKLDLIVIGSVVVTRDGRRIGNKNRYSDIQFALLMEYGFITPETKIATIVHDSQIIEDMPEKCMTPHDIPVDIIVTPTEVIRVETSLPRPTGIFWDRISQRQLKMLSLLKELKEKKEAAGETIVIKETKPRVYRKKPKSKTSRNKFSNSRKARRNTENSEVDENEADIRPRGIWLNRWRRTTKKSKVSNQELKVKPKRKVVRRRMTQNTFCVKVSNIARGVAVKDFKTELKKNECQPNYLHWNARNRFCVLNYNRKTIDTNEEDGGIDKILKALQNLSIEFEADGETKTSTDFCVKLMENTPLSEDIQKIVSVDSTTV